MRAGWIAALAACLSACAALGAPPPETPPVIRSTAPAATLPAASATPSPVLFVLTDGDEIPWLADLEAWAVERGWNVGFQPEAGELTGGQEGMQVAVTVRSGIWDSQVPGQGLWVVAVEEQGLEPGPRLSVVGQQVRRDQAGFLLGAVAGTASRTGRVGVVDGTGGPDEPVYRAAFLHGLRYACPRCVLVEIPAAEITADRLRAHAVELAFVVPGPGAEAAARIDHGAGWLLWAESPIAPEPEAALAGAAVDSWPVVRLALEALFSGEVGRAWPYELATGSIALVGLDEQIIGPGRMARIEEIRAALARGDLETGVEVPGRDQD